MEMHRDDITRVVASLPAKLGNALRDMGPRAFVAGGYIRALVAREAPSDVDVFVRDEATAKELLEALGYENPYTTDFATTIFLGQRMVQIIHRWNFERADEILAHFDFTVAQAVVWYDPEYYQGHEGDWVGVCSAHFYMDLAARRIVYTQRVREPVESSGTLARLMKYTARGYSASPETVVKVMADAMYSAQQRIDEAEMYGPSAPDVVLSAWREIDPVPARAWL